MRSIRRDLVAWVAGGTAVVVLISGLCTYALARAGLRRHADAALEARARSFASVVIDEQPDPDENDPGGLVFDYKGSLAESDLGAVVRITSDEGVVLAVSPGWERMKTGAGPSETGSMAVVVAAATMPSGAPGRLVRVVAEVGAEQPVEADDEDGDGADDDELPLIGSGRRVMVEVVGSDAALRASQRSVLAAVVAGTVVSGLGAMMVVRVAVGRGLRPVVELASRVRAMPVGEFGPVDRSGAEAAELAPITESVNDLLGRVRAAVARERRFTDAAAHELRTPVAELRMIAEVAARFPDPERSARGVEEAGAIGREIAELLEALLVATRGEATISGASEPARIGPVVSAAVERWREKLDQRGVSVSMEVDAAASWDVPPGAATMIVRNLVDNAADYTPPGGSIRIVATAGSAGAQVEVRNAPVDLTEEQAAHLFEPFWRADASRTDRAHRGLGLAIVATQCEASGLRCGARITREGELVMSIAPRERSA